MIMNHPIAKYMHGYFQEYLVGTKGLSRNTVLAYRDTLRLFFVFTAEDCRKNVDDLLVEDLDGKRVLAFLNHLETVRKNAVRTRNLRLAGIRSFFGFIAREEPELLDLCSKIRSIPSKRVAHKSAEYLENEEVTAIFEAVDLDARQGIRDYALLHFLFNTGARAQEVVDLSSGDLRLEGFAQVRIRGKGNKVRACPLWPQTAQQLEDLLQTRKTAEEANGLFLNARGRPLTRFGIGYIVKKYAAIAEKACPSLTRKSISPHTFRHSTAMMLLRAGNDINMIQDWLGHADINTTHAYFELDMEMKRKVLERAGAFAPDCREAKPRWRHKTVLSFLDQLTRGGLEYPSKPA